MLVSLLIGKVKTDSLFENVVARPVLWSNADRWIWLVFYICGAS
jgi:hypothetical protein